MGIRRDVAACGSFDFIWDISQYPMNRSYIPDILFFQKADADTGDDHPCGTAQKRYKVTMQKASGIINMMFQ